MAVSSANIRWKEGKIVFPALYWKSPSKRRIPRLLIEDRALEVGILICIEGSWVIFEETTQISDQIQVDQDTIKLDLYAGRFHLVPEKLKRQDSFEWLSKLGNKALFWGKDNQFYIKAIN